VLVFFKVWTSRPVLQRDRPLDIQYKIVVARQLFLSDRGLILSDREVVLPDGKASLHTTS
jgi:hypothetical protein